jgi:hypothetical protein
MKLRMAGIAAAALLMAAPVAHADLVTNGGFENTDQNGDFMDGWTMTNDNTCNGQNCSFDWAAIGGTYVPNSGNYEALLGTEGQDGTLSQTITDTAGQNLVLRYWLASDGATTNDFSALWDGKVIAGSALTDIPLSGYTEYTFDVLATGSDVLAFDERDDGGWLSLDDVSLNEVPEPGTLALFGAALVGLATLRRRKTTLA